MGACKHVLDVSVNTGNGGPRAGAVIQQHGRSHDDNEEVFLLPLHPSDGLDPPKSR